MAEHIFTNRNVTLIKAPRGSECVVSLSGTKNTTGCRDFEAFIIDFTPVLGLFKIHPDEFPGVECLAVITIIIIIKRSSIE